MVLPHDSRWINTTICWTAFKTPRDGHVAAAVEASTMEDVKTTVSGAIYFLTCGALKTVMSNRFGMQLKMRSSSSSRIPVMVGRIVFIRNENLMGYCFQSRS